MIRYENEYKAFIRQQGVGKNDIVASSQDSYIGYLRVVSRLLGQDISPTLIQNKNVIDEIIQSLEGLREKKTLSNYKTALNQYLRFCQER